MYNPKSDLSCTKQKEQTIHLLLRLDKGLKMNKNKIRKSRKHLLMYQNLITEKN
jgi:hypothetical protein